MRKLYILLIVALVLALFISSFVEARERKYGGSRTSKTASKKSDVASGLDDEDDSGDDDKPHAKQFESALDDSEDDDDDDDDDDDEIHSGLGDLVEDDSAVGDAGQATFSESYTLDENGNKVYTWKNTERTTALWHAISSGDMSTLERMLQQDPDVIHYRAEDGRGALFWAYEFDRMDMVSALLERGADAEQTDKNGEKPAQLSGRAAN